METLLNMNFSLLLLPENASLLVILMVFAMFKNGLSGTDSYKQFSEAVHPDKFISVVDGSEIKDDSYYCVSGCRSIGLSKVGRGPYIGNRVRDIFVPSEYSNERLKGFLIDSNVCFLMTHWRIMEFKRELTWKVENGKSRQEMEWTYVKSHDGVSVDDLFPYIRSKFEPYYFEVEMKGTRFENRIRT